MPYYGDGTLPYYYGGPFSNHSSLMTGTGRTMHSPLGSTRYAPHLTTISESPLSALRRYTPAATMGTRPKRVIDTADIDVSTPRALSHTTKTSNDNNHQRHRLRRDRPTIRIRSQALKDNPALREHYERHEKTVGELLVEKFLIKDKKPDTESGETRTKLYTQVSLDSDAGKKNDQLQEALYKRITRRMTRRRSSADVQMDAKQLEREVIIAQAQADALDSLVAQEQAEIEVETRMGTLIRKNLVRSMGSRSKHDKQTLTDDEDDETRTKKLAKKMKKRKKTTDKPSPPSGSELDSEHDIARPKKVSRDATNEKLANNDKDAIGDADLTQVEAEDDQRQNEAPMSPTKALKFKIEASNSVGDFSTLWINANIAEEQEQQRNQSHAIVEQFRDSVRLPAPKNIVNKIVNGGKNDKIIEEHQQIVVLPVKKRYVKDDARNSVYLTLKTQKSANASQMSNETTDDKANQTSSIAMTNGRSHDAEKSTKSPIANATTLLTRQPRVDKVAKFRSKDITESDVEVKSISELPGNGAKRGKIGMKDGLQKLLSVSNVDDIDEESISLTSKRDATSVAPQNGDLSKDLSNAKILKLRENGSKSLEDSSIKKDDTLEIGRSETIDLSPRSVDKRVVENGTSKVSTIGAVENKICKPLKRAKKETKETRKNVKSVNDEETARTKLSGASSLDSTKAIGSAIAVENLESRKIDDKKKDEKDKERISSSSSLTPCSNLVGSLPNAPIINSSDVANRLNEPVNINREESNCARTENGESSRIVDNHVVKEDLSLSPKITGLKDAIEAQVEISRPFGIEGQVDELLDRPKVNNESQNVVEQSTIIESPKIHASTKKDVNAPKTENTVDKPVKLTKNIPSKIDEKNADDTTKLRKYRKPLSLSTNIDDKKTIELSPDIKNLEVIPDSPKKIQGLTKKRALNAINGDESRSKIDKTPITKINKPTKDLKKETVIETKITNGCEKKDITLVPLESTKPLKDASKTKSKTIIEDSTKQEIKVAKKLESPSTKKEEEFDFWGEIESQRTGKATKIVESPVNSEVSLITDLTAEKTKVPDSMVIVLEPEVKSETSREIGPPNERVELVEVEKKANKAKKKKKMSEESSGCKKKDQEKAMSGDTIFEQHFTSSDAVDAKSHQQTVELLEQRSSANLDQKNFVNEASDEITCDSPDIERFEVSLSTIVEESLSPVTEEVPKNGLDLMTSNLRNKDESSALSKLESGKNLSSTDSISGSLDVETTEKASCLQTNGEPEVIARIVSCQDNTVDLAVPIEPEKRLLEEPSSLNPERSLPTINIVEVPSTPILEAPISTATAEEEVPEDEEGPGTPTNETVDEETKTSSSITKWNAIDDLSLDQPDKEIGPEALPPPEVAKIESTKKKVGSTKKTSKKKSSIGSNSTKSTSASPDSSKKKKLGKRKKSTTKTGKDGEKRVDERESKLSNSSDTTLKPGGLNVSTYSPINSGRNSPKQRPLDLIKMFYTTPASLLTATPRDLSKVRRAKIKKRKHSSRTASASSDSTGSTRSTQSTGTTESTGSTEHEDDAEQKRISSTRSNDSGFDGSPRLSNCDMACHKKCEKLTGNLCGLNQKLVAEALQALKRAPSQSSDNQRNSDGSDHHASGRITPPATNLPRFKKYTVMDFNFLKVLGKGSFGKVLLAELRRTDCVYAVKCLKKDVVLEDDDVECTLIERKVLTLATRHPYLCHLFCTFQTDSHLFFVMEYLNGGDLMFHIQKSGRFAEARARFYAAEIWSGLNFLHKKGIVYRDLKLDNVLLDFEGHIRIADFGMCKLQIFLDRTADTFCGTPDYMAPEIIKGLKYNQAVDWWSFGVLLYEMLTGQSPFSGCDEDELFWSICNERPFIPRYLSQEAMDVLVCLLEKDAGKRPPAHEIAVHPFFHALQWDRLERRQLEPPFKPALEHTLDTRYFDTAFTAERPRLTPVPERLLTSMDQGVFRGFSYTNPNATD